jgi:hypothetical protein
MLPDLDQLEERYLAQITASDNLDGLDAIRVDALGKKRQYFHRNEKPWPVGRRCPS